MEENLVTHILVVKQQPMATNWFDQLKAWVVPSTSWYGKARDIRAGKAGCALWYGTQTRYIGRNYTIAAWPFMVTFDRNIVVTIDGEEYEFTEEQLCWLFGCYVPKFDEEHKPLMDDEGVPVFNWETFELRTKILRNFMPYQRGVMLFFFDEKDLMYSRSKDWFPREITL